MPVFIKRTTEDVFDRIASRLENETTISAAKTAGSKARVVLAAVSEEFGTGYEILDNSIIATLIGKASGLYLDMYGEIYDLPRMKASGADISAENKIFKFYTKTSFGDINRDSGGNPQSFTIPKGVMISSLDEDEDKIKYFTSTAVTCNANDNMVWFAAESAKYGADARAGANVLRSHNFVGYTNANTEDLKVTNKASIVGPQDEESDEHYRYRIINQAISGEKANESAIRLAILSTPGVANVKIWDLGKGIGSFVVFVKPIIISAGQDLLDRCWSAVDMTKARGIVSVIKYPTRFGVEMEAFVRFRGNYTNLVKQEILNTATVRVWEYLANLDMGDEFVVNEVVQRIMETDDRILDVGTSSQPIERLWVWRDNILEDGRYRSVLLGNYKAGEYEIVTYEYSIDDPIVITEQA